MTSQPSGELGPSEPSLMDIAAEMDEQPGDVVDADESEELEELQDVEVDAEEQDDQEESDEEDEAETQVDEDPEVEVGDSKVKLSELKAGYMKDADYRRKTSEVAETTRAVEGERHEVQQQREYLAKQTGPLLHLLREQLIGSQQRLAQLATEDPAAWVSENQQFQQRAQMFDALLAENEQLSAQSQADQKREEDRLAREEREILREKLKEWNDPKVAAAEQTQMAQYLLDLGYAREELEMLTDHRALLAVRDAAKWREHLKTRESARAKKGQPSPPERVVKPGAAKVPVTQQQRRIAEANKRLSSNPNDLRSLAALAREGGF